MNFSKVSMFLVIISMWLRMEVNASSGTLPNDRSIFIQTPIDIPTKNGQSIQEILRDYFDVSDEYDWVFIQKETDRKKVTHSRYQQFFKGVKVEDAVIVIHSENGITKKFHGVVMKPESGSASMLLSQDDVKLHFNNSTKSKNCQPENSHPVIHSCELLWVWSEAINNFSLQYKIDFFAANSLENQTSYLDANTGSELSTAVHSCHADVPATAHTAYHGTKSIMTHFSQGYYKLQSTSRGLGIETMNLNQQLNYNSKTEFIDADNIWEQTSVTNENYATDAHFAAEQFYDFLNVNFNRNSIDNNGQKLLSYLNYGNGMRNAFWNGNAVVYGSGNTSGGPLTTLDIAGHEFTHGLIQKTANLNYTGEPGTINEAIADIFGTSLENFATLQNANWFIGEQSGTALRSMSDPQLFNQPSTYLGNNWYFGSGDNGGVHINSGFINKWFYLLTEGGQGVNDNGVSYHVQGITIQKSIEIVYHTLVAYAIPGTDFKTFMNFTLASTIDLHGACSQEYIAVLNAWKAVGLYDFTTATVNLQSTSGVSFCEGDSLLLKTDGLPGAVYTWYRNGLPIASAQNTFYNVSTAGMYLVGESRCGNLFFSDSMQITSLSLPVVSTSSVNICEGSSTMLTGFPVGGDFSIPNPYTGSSTSFAYTFTDNNGCSATATGNVSVNENPAVHILNIITSLPQNAAPVFLEGNVQGVFTGQGVTGNYFNPDSFQPGTSYPVVLNYTNNSGCIGADTVLFEITKPCLRDHSEIKMETSNIQIGENAITRIHVNVSAEDFSIEWIVPSNLVIISNHGDSIVEILTPAHSVEIQVILTNTCGESFIKSLNVHPAQPESELNFIIHPNPAKTSTQITFSNNFILEPFNLTVTDAKGKLVRTYVLHNANEIIDLNGIHKGVYNLVIRKNGEQLVKKLVIN